MSELRPQDELRAALDRFLPGVQGPARYLGLERNLIRKPWDEVAVRVALAFPDAYEIGMSHQGTRILYHLINRRPDALAERCFAPLPDMAAALRERGLPLYTLESYRAVRDFEIIGISLQSELNYINIPYLLDLAGVSRRAATRRQAEPLVLGGGPCTANPEPVADFFDAILIGDGEAALDEILDVVAASRAAGMARIEILRRLAGIRGVYVPQLYRWQRSTADGAARWEVLDPAAPMPVSRVWVERLDAADQPELPIVPFADVIQDRLGMEIMRGCTQGCRFCQAGYWYRPVREHDPKAVVERMERQVDETGFEEVGLLSLSTADYSQVESLVGTLSDRLRDRRVSVSLPSLRADAFSVGLAEAVSTVRKSGFTFAPETGSDRLRRVINKTFTNDDMVRAAEAAFARGWQLIKVYAMIGLPTETDEDLEALARLTEDILRAGRRVSGRRVEVKVSVGCFIPKAWTPFQWQPFVPPDELRRRIRILRERFHRMRGARLTWSEPDEAALEALLSRGGRELAATIERAHSLGAVFDGWSDHINLGAWRQAIADTGVELESELGGRETGAVLPWDIIDAGVRKGYLKSEWRRALREIATEDCKWGRCYHCGIPGDGVDIQLAESTLPLIDALPAEAGRPRAAAYRLHPEPRAKRPDPGRAQPPVYRRFRFGFAKAGDARYLSHRQVMDALGRALRAAGVPARYTEGYNPHIRVSMGPALAVGHEGLAEAFDVDCTAPVRGSHVDAMNRLLPEGLRILQAQALLPQAPSLGKLVAAAAYLVGEAGDGGSWPADLSRLPSELAAAVRRWEPLPDGRLRVELNLREDDGPTATVKELLVGFGIEEPVIPLVRVTRERLVLQPRAAATSSTSEQGSKDGAEEDEP